MKKGTANRLLSAVSAGLAMTAMLSTGVSATAVHVAKVKAKPITVAVVSLFANDEWSAQFLGGIGEMANTYSQVHLIETQASYNQAEMVTQLNTVIMRRPNVIIVNHAAQSSALQPAIQKAVAQGIKVITVSLVMPVKGVAQAHQNNVQLAQMSLNEMAKGIHNKGNIAVIWVGGFAPMIERMQALQQFLKTHPHIHVVATYGDASNTTISDTISRTQALLRQYPQKGQLTAIWASWDQFAIGAVRADQMLHRNVPVYGIDVSNQDVAMMRASHSPWKVTAATDTYEYGATVMRYAIMDAYGQHVPAHIWIPGALIKQNNLPKQGESIHQYFLSIFPKEAQVANPPLLKELAKLKK
ncbi:MAG: substrate-binding domain-containing protein [Bacilli bacterium]